MGWNWKTVALADAYADFCIQLDVFSYTKICSFPPKSAEAVSGGTC